MANRKRTRDFVTHIPENWASWIKTSRYHMVAILRRELAPDEDNDAQGPDVMLYFPTRYNNLVRGFGVDLTEMSELELNAVEAFVNELFALARPIVQLRDKKAVEDYEQGRDDFSRMYKSPPEMVTRPWALGINRESIFERLAWDAGTPRSKRNSDEPILTDGDAMAQSDTLDSRTPNDQPTPFIS